MIVLLVLIPLVAATLSYVEPRSGRALTTVIAIAGVAASGWLALHLVWVGPVDMVVADWPQALGIRLRADGTSGAMILLTWVVALFVTLYARPYFDHEPRMARSFWPLWLFLLTTLTALFLSHDLFNQYVTLELLGLCGAGLVAVSGQKTAYRAALRYLLVALTGSLFFLAGTAVLYAQHGTLELELLAGLQQRDSSQVQGLVAWALISVGLLLKAGLFPMHTWLPIAHGNALGPVSAVLSGLVVKAPLFILVRNYSVIFVDSNLPLFGTVIGLLAAGAMIWGGLQALVATRLKFVIAYSTVAQLGYLFLFFPLAADHVSSEARGGFVIMCFAHGTGKAAMFMAASNLAYATGNDGLGALRGIWRRLPVSSFAFALAGVGLTGLPPSAGFAAKYVLLVESFDNGTWWWAVLLALGSLLGAAWVFRLAQYAFVDDALAMEESQQGTRVVPGAMEWSALLLALISVGIGFASAWIFTLAQVGSRL